MRPVPSRKQCPRKLATMQTDYHSCPAQIKERHSRYQHLRRFCNGTQSACHNEQKKNRQHQCTFSLPRQTYPASPAQSSLPASYFPFRAIPERCFPAKNTASTFASFSSGNALVSVTIGPPQYVPSFFCIRYFTERKLSENFSASPITAASIIHPSAPGRQVPSPRQRPRYCLSRFLPPVPSSTMRTAKHLLLFFPAVSRLCGQTLSEVQKPDGEPAAREAGWSEKCLSQAAEKEAAVPRRFHSPF